EKLTRSHALIIEALYDLALVYKDQMKDEKKAITTFEDLIARYDSSKYHANTYYQLYRLYTAQGNQPKSDYYQNLVLTEYGDSDYAKVIKNPNYAAEALASENLIHEVYERAYTYFREGFYQNAYDMVIKSMTEFPNSEYQPQLKFLE